MESLTSVLRLTSSLSLAVCHAEGVQSSSTPAQLTAGEDQDGVTRAGKENEKERSDTFSRCSIDWIGYPPKEVLS